MLADREKVDTKVSPRVKVFAAAGIVGALALFLAFNMLGRGTDESSAAPPAKQGLLEATSAAKRVAAKANRRIAAPNGSSRKAAATRRLGARRPVSSPAAVVDGNLPVSIAAALRHHGAVVVALFDAQGGVDRLALAEARAGARLAGAGFVRINVLDQGQVKPLTDMLGVDALASPAVLVFKRPGEVTTKIDGYADSETIAQAAANAAPLEAKPVVRVPQIDWPKEANAVCGRNYGKNGYTGVGRISVATSNERLYAWAPKVQAAQARELAQLQALALPRVPAKRAEAVALLRIFRRVHELDVELLGYYKRGDMARVQDLASKQAALGNQGNLLARRIGAPACAHFND